MALYKCPFCKKEIEDGIDALVEHRKEECERIQMAGMTPEERLLMHVFGDPNREKEMEIKSARRKSFDVTYVVVTEENIEEVAAWCNGEVGGEGKERFVKVTDKNAISTRQAKAFVDDYVLKMSETGSSFKAFTEKAFKKSYDTIEASGQKIQKVARSAKDGQFVSQAEAKANPDTTVTEAILISGPADFDGDTVVVVLPDTSEEGKDPEHWEDSEGPQHDQPYWEVHNDETVYFNAQGETITKAEYDAWGK